MDRRANQPGRSDLSPPSAIDLFVQAILGKPVSSAGASDAEVTAELQQLEWLATISTRHAEELRALQAAESDARRKREILEWAAQISTVAEAELRSIQQSEQRQQQSWQAAQRFAQTESLTEWNETDHPRAPKGTTTGGQFVSKNGGSVGTADLDASPSTGRRVSGGGSKNEPNPEMLELAHTWWQTKDALDQARQDLKNLPQVIARELANYRAGGRYAYVHSKNVGTARRELEIAKSIAPELEKQLIELKQAYHDAGFDDVPYATFTPGETRVGGTGIEDVGWAVARGGTPAGLRPTGIEVDIATAALGGPAILRLGKAALSRIAAKKALGKATGTADGSIDDFIAKLPRKPTPTKKAANQFEIKYTGSDNYKLTGGGESFAIDYRDTIILEAKHVGKVRKSPVCAPLINPRGYPNHDPGKAP